jgi:osmoprotectant transport system substrate-binding protein
VGQVSILQKPAIADSAELYKAVKATYNEELNLVWLKPFGFDNKSVAPAGTAAEAAPVVRKDTLKKFPALARLINKLGGRIDASAIAKLETSAKGGDSKKVARQFLRENRLI